MTVRIGVNGFGRIGRLVVRAARERDIEVVGVVSRDVIGGSGFLRLRRDADPGPGSLVKVFGWYDNEWGYTQRLLDLVQLVAGQLVAETERVRP